MSQEKIKDVPNGMYECEILTGADKGKKAVYHSSTLNAVQNKGLLKKIKQVKIHKPKTIKE